MFITKSKDINNKLNELSLPFLMFDITIKAIFSDEVNILAKMVSDITGIDYKLLEDNVILETNELPVSRNKEKAKKCDFILKINEDNILNLEINTSYYPEVVIKNLSYLFGIYSRSAKRGKDYNENILIRQVNLNCYDNEKDKVLSKYTLLEEETHKLYSNSVAIFDLNVAKCSEAYYNLSKKEEIPNYIRWGALLYNRNLEKIPEIAYGIMTDKEIEIIMDKIDKLTDDSLFMSDLETIEMHEKEERAIRAYEIKIAAEQGMAKGMAEGKAKGKAEGKAEGMAEGIEKNTKEMIRAMIKNNATLDFISKVTNKSIKEIEKIIKE